MMDQENQAPLLIVNYHYVRDPGQYLYPGIHPVDPADFDQQIRQLMDHYYFATPEEVEAFAHGDNNLPGPSIFLTFDDGLIDHWQAAQGVLKERNISSAFFVNSRPLTERRALTVHKIHWLRANTPPKKFREEIVKLLPKEGVDLSMDETLSEEARKINPYDPLEIANLKYLINFRLPQPLVDELSTEMLRLRSLPEEDFCGMFYMNESQLNELVHQGHIVGNHGHTHTPFTKLERDEVTQELELNNSCLEGILGVRPSWISFPYGMEPEETETLCRNLGFTVGLGLEKGWNNGVESPYRLNRVNPNDVAGFL